MASYEKDLPPVPHSRTPSLYSRLKAVGHRALKSRNEDRSNHSSHDLHSARPPSSAHQSGRPSINYEREARLVSSQPCSSTTSPEYTRKRTHVPQSPSPELYRQSVGRQQRSAQQKLREHPPPQPHIVSQAVREPAHSYYNQSQRPQTARPDVPYSYQAPTSTTQSQYESNVYHNYPQPQSSQRLLRRKPSIIADYVSESRAGLREEDEASMQSPETSPVVSKTSLRRPQQASPSVQRQTPESMGPQTLRHPTRALVTPDSSRSYSRAAMNSSVTPSSPSTYRHDTPSIFSHASRATSRTAYTPSSATPYMEAQHWNEFPVPPLPDVSGKSAAQGSNKQPFIPPELAHLAYGQDDHYASKVEHNESVRAGLDALTSIPQSPEHIRSPGPKSRAAQLINDEPRRSPVPLSAMDPALRSRVTLNTSSADLASPQSNKSGAKSPSRSTNTRKPVARSATRSATGSTPATKSSATGAAATPRLSLDKPRRSLTQSFRRTSFSAKNSPRMSFQCQGPEDAVGRSPEDRYRPSSVTSQDPRASRAQHSRAFSFSKAGVKAKSSAESLKSLKEKFSFAQRMFMKSATCIPSMTADLAPGSSDSPIDKEASVHKDASRSTAEFGSAHHRTAPRETKKVADSVTPSSRTSVDRARQNVKAGTTSKLPEVVRTRDSLSQTRPITKQDDIRPTAQAVRRKPVPVSPDKVVQAQKVSASIHDLESSSSAASEHTLRQKDSDAPGVSNTGHTDGEEFIRFSTITGTRTSLGSSSSSSEGSAAPIPLSRLQSADSGRSSGLASYGLFPKLQNTSQSSRPIMMRQPSSQDSAPTTSSVAQVAVARTASVSTAVRQRAAVGLRLGALTASTVMTGKALFSPADIQLTQGVIGEKALVMDGSGEDWSLYCAAIYPSADVFNLPLMSSQSTTRDELTKLRGLTNHKEVPHSFLSAQFPLPSNHFSVVVLRFPPAMDETLLRHIIAESKRVLRPGGYIEIFAMDLDLAKMGSDTRRAVRDHKIQMHHTNSNVCLKPASDNLQRLLAHRGFENLKSGLILLPAASENVEPINRAWLQRHEEAQPHAELSTKPSEGTFLPGEVGRWWYKQSYEGHDTSTSIWQDPLVLRECSRLQTSFKLLMCYAQKPTIVKRRTVSL